MYIEASLAQNCILGSNEEITFEWGVRQGVSSPVIIVKVREEKKKPELKRSRKGE